MRIKNITFGLFTLATVACATIIIQYGRTTSPPLVFAITATGLPMQIIIPRIHVNASIEQVSKNENGLLHPPISALSIGWDRASSLPGEEGNAVVTGSVRRAYGAPGMFGDIGFLKVGDPMSVENDKGIALLFIVREIKTYDLSDDMTEVFNSSDRKSHLNLITSDGIWYTPSKGYSKRLVIFADKQTPATTVLSFER